MTATATPTPASDADEQIDALGLLEQHHATIRQLFEYFQNSTDPAIRRAIAHRICRLVSVQIVLEEEILYPVARQTGRHRDLLCEAQLEGNFVKKVVEQVMSLPHEDRRFAATVGILGDYVQDYIDQQQEQIFPRLKRDAKRELSSLGNTLADRRAELLAQA